MTTKKDSGVTGGRRTRAKATRHGSASAGSKQARRDGQQSQRGSRQPGIVKLGPALCLANVREARQQLLALQYVTQAVTIDVSAVKTVDTAGIHLLLACAKTLRKKAIALNWLGHSAAISTAVNCLRVNSVLSLPDDEE